MEGTERREIRHRRQGSPEENLGMVEGKPPWFLPSPLPASTY